MNEVWLLVHKAYGYTQVWDADTDVLEIPAVKEELSYLVGAYDDEREEFIACIDAGMGASIEFRFSIRKEKVRSL